MYLSVQASRLYFKRLKAQANYPLFLHHFAKHIVKQRLGNSGILVHISSNYTFSVFLLNEYITANMCI